MAYTNLSEAAVREICRERGIAINRRGAGYELIGPGVEIFCTDLQQLRTSDLQPRPESDEPADGGRWSFR